MFSLRYLDATSCSFQNDTLLCLLLVSTFNDKKLLNFVSVSPARDKRFFSTYMYRSFLAHQFF